MGRVLATIATILIFVLAAAFLLPAVVDWESYRSALEDAASTALGRKISTKGTIDITLLPEPRVRLGQVTVASNGKGLRTAAITAEAVDVALSLQGLLGGRIEANNVKLLRPALQLDLSKPKRPDGFSDLGAFAVAADIHNLEIVDGRLTVFAKELAAGKPLFFDKINGTLSSPPGGESYRFGGRFARDGKLFDIKFLTSQSADGNVRLSGAIADPASKSSVQGDGTLFLRNGPAFEGSLGITASASSDFRMQVQAKSAVKLDLSGMSLTDLSITVDPENRPQTLSGSGSIVYASETASFVLQARSLDADLLLQGGRNSLGPESPPSDWEAFLGAANQLLWFYPDAALRLSLAVGQVQLRGEPIENVELDAQRLGNRWVFEKVLGLLPGDTALKVVGTLARSDRSPQLSGVVSADGKNLSRLARWFAPAISEAKGLPPRPFTVKGSMTLSDSVAAFEGITGSIAGTPFSASLHLDKAPDRRLSLSLSGDSFDLSGLDFAQGGAEAQAFGGLPALQAYFSKNFPSLAGYSEGLVAADFDISVGEVKTSILEARNLTARVKFSPDMLAISKLSAETSEGLSVRGEGVVPLKGAGQGKFDGHIDAQSAQALRQIAQLAGYDSLGGRKFEDFAPASLAINYGARTDTGDLTAKVTGNLGGTRLEGQGQLKGTLADWRNEPLSLQLDGSAPNGNQLLLQLFPRARSAPALAQAPGTLSLRMKGKADRLDTSLTLKAPLLQFQLDGATSIKDATFAFAGKGSATSLTPDLFLPSSVLALIAGDSPSNLRLEANLALKPNQIEAEKLKAESAQNTVTGSLSLDTSGSIARLEADLKTDRFSLPAMLNYFLAPSLGRNEGLIPAANPISSSLSNVWPDRPFSLPAFENASAHISLDAKTLKISDALAASGGQIEARLENGRFEIQRLEGKVMGGGLKASLALEARGGSITATNRISLSDIDLVAFPGGGQPPLLSGKASVLLSASGQGLSPHGLVSVMRGRGRITISDGQIFKLSPFAIHKVADEMLANPQPLSEEAIVKRALEAVQSGNFKFRHLAIPVVIRDGVLEMRRASFRSRDDTIRAEAYLDLSKMQVDSTWQIGVRSDRRAKWPPVKLTSAGSLLELGGHPQSLAAEDFARAIIVRKMEGDINRLEGLNRPHTPPQWTTTQESASDKSGVRQRNVKTSPQAVPNAGGGEAVEQNGSSPIKIPSALPPSDFEKRMRDALRAQDAANSDPASRR